MELRQLRYFVMVSKTLNFSEAARRLFITQGTLSQQIMQLENEIDAQLFDRSGHAIALTEAGEELLPLAVQTIQDADICNNRMKDLKGAVSGTLRIGTTHSFSAILADAASGFLKQNPGVKLKIQSETAADLIDLLRDRELDLALAFKPVKVYDDIESEPLFKSNLSAIMRREHPLASRRSLTLEELENHRIVLPGKGLQARRTFDRFLGLDTRKLNVTVEVNDPDLIMDLVQCTNLIAIVSTLATFYRPNLVAVPLEGANYTMTGCVHRLKDGYRKKSADIFLKLLHNSAQIERIVKGLNV